ncbi:MAG TPA: type II toxin-antitoxin system VapC family toxin [Verrucomicrobiota bacterium]|nr:type II toxin-antitoxin system VapC family toxin [Verrucomicrobiota bacterium]HRZ34963.1 type II toxin-antitoxin system VapC family toxin [Candidatus Paceibacterota bacterium]HRZ53965.1 type II toxin-antitoxin system VapC family toxin [Candidatus Paceibacterota bacterium]
MRYLLDTCAILFIAENATDLSAATLRLIDDAPAGDVFVSAISVAELACLCEREKITLKQHWRLWWNVLLNRTAWTCLPITAEIMAEAYSLPPPIHRDPADRVLIATARHERLTLVTTDGKIRGYPHVGSIG